MILGVLLAAFLVLQLVQPQRPGPQLPGDGRMTDHVSVSEDVEAILRRACYDCHSGETRWPWYSHIAPISWVIAGDVEHGRSNLDFSHWATDPYREPTPVQRLRWTCRETREEIMPPKLYRLVHPGARLSAAQRDSICAWTTRVLRELAMSATGTP